MTYYPILLFTYKKIKPLRQMMEALWQNSLAKHSELYIFSDGPKSAKDTEQVTEIRHFLTTVDGFRKITIKEAATNKGLAASIIDGVTAVLEDHNAVIVLEDDLVTSPNFLDFMNEALRCYEADPKILSISGFTVPIKVPTGYLYDNYFTRRATSWGWATWKDRWDDVDWTVSDYTTFANNRQAKKAFNAMGSDMTSMLAKQMNGVISSWAIRWCYHQFKKDLYTVFPVMSKISNIGFGDGATHTKSNNSRYATPLDVTGKTTFEFINEVHLDPEFINQFTSYYSISTRVYYKLRSLIGK